MSKTAIDGVVAAGRVPTWIVPAALVTTAPTPGAGTYKIPLAALSGTGAVKVDCYLDAGDITVGRTPQTRTRQRMCQKVAQTITTGETIDVTLSAVYDQQALTTAIVNKAYAALPEGADVYIVQAFGWDQAADPTTSTVVDAVRGTVQQRMKNQPTSADEDLKFVATISGSAFYSDLALSTP